MLVIVGSANRVFRWKLYMVFMTLCTVMAIVVFLFYPVSRSLKNQGNSLTSDRKQP